VLCDSGDISFSVKPVPTPQVPAVSATAGQFREADFHEQIYGAPAVPVGEVSG
jgi:hypothetical protein